MENLKKYEYLFGHTVKKHLILLNYGPKQSLSLHIITYTHVHARVERL